MGVTDASAFPCCSKSSVDIVERLNDNYHQPQLQEEKLDEIEEKLDEKKLETDLPEQEFTIQEDPYPSPYPDPGPGPDTEPEPPQPEPQPDPKPWLEKPKAMETQPNPEVKEPQSPPKGEGKDAKKSSRHQVYRIESVKPYEDTQPHNLKPWSFNTNSSNRDEEQASCKYRSIHVQTSSHLFWADKLIQASEHSIRSAFEMQCDSTTPEHSHVLSTQLVLPGSTPQQMASPCLSITSLPAALGLADLINFASSLALASSSNIGMPNLEGMIKPPSEKAQEPSAETIQPAQPTQPTQPLQLFQATQSVQPAPTKQEMLEKLPQTLETLTQETRSFPCSYLDFSKARFKKATIEGEVEFLQTPAMSSQLQEPKEKQQNPEDQEIPDDTEKLQKPRNLFTRDSREEQAGRTQKGKPQLNTAQPTQPESAAAIEKDEQTTQGAREFKGPAATCPTWSGTDASSQSSTDESLTPLTPRQLAAFQDIFKLFSCSPTGTVDMHSMKMTLRNVGIQLGPREMCEALRLADLDGDGIVSFKDFLGVLTNNHYLAQCMGQVKSDQDSESPGLQTLFLEVLLKLLSQGFVSSKSGQELMSYYFKKQQALQWSPGWKSRARGQGRSPRANTGLNFFCQAVRLSGLSSSQLARSLHALYKAGARSPYSQIPNLAGKTRQEHKTQSRAPGPNARLPKPHQTSRPKPPSNLGPLCKGPFRPPAGLASQPLEQIRPLKAPSPPTLVQKHPLSPSPACFQRSSVKCLYK